VNSRNGFDELDGLENLFLVVIFGREIGWEKLVFKLTTVFKHF
jgi:hypothetical protein